MKTNFFPMDRNSLLVCNEAKKKIITPELIKLQLASKYDVIKPIKKETLEIVFITSYPPRECGIATYSQDLKNAILEKFNK